uniref:FYVE-type domain-containing protein n=1 Tax=Globodera rostochiensis TaxID=31243 RepID=A0A914H971_GLORO
MEEVEDVATTPPETPNGQCEMCANYELSLQTLQTSQDTLREQLAAAKELYEKYGNELSEERRYRKELEGRFAALNDEIEQKIEAFLEAVTKFEERISLLAKKQETDLADLGHELDVAKERQTQLQTDLKTLYEKYQRLLHKNAQKAEEMRDQCIDLPQTVDELTLLALQLHEDLISEKASREHECQELRDELTVAREQMLEMDIRANENEQQLLIYAQHAQQQQQQLEQQQRERHYHLHHRTVGDEGGRRQQQQHNQPQQSGTLFTQNAGPDQLSSPNTARSPRQQQQTLEQQKSVDVGEVHVDCCPDAKCQRLTIELERRLHRSMNERARLQELLVEQRSKCTQMQSELDTSEAVQKDFVRLSQNLQVELEKIRQSECEVRWQDERDFDRCNDCSKELVSGPGVNCRHCGKIFCSACTANNVLSGPAKRPMPVCVLCHTLLSNKEDSLVDRLNISNGGRDEQQQQQQHQEQS